MKTKILALLLLISFNSISQISYQKGYYIDNNNNRIEGFIKNYDWKNNPTSFEFKKSLDLNSETIHMFNSKEFGVDESVIFVKFQVEIERSSERTGTIGYKKDPVFSNETLFLKLIVNGKNKLYSYYDGGIEKFFYSTETVPTKQLVFIKYIVDSNAIRDNVEYKDVESGSVLLNEYYKKQLWLDVRCQENLVTEPSKVKYSVDDLSKYFISINKCNGDKTEEQVFKMKKSIFSIKAVALMNKSSMDFKGQSKEGSFPEAISFGLGAELEFLFPFSDYKWSLFFEPSFGSFSGETTSPYGANNSLNQKVSIKMNYIAAPLGLRYYMYLNNSSKLFLSSGLNIKNISSDTKIDFEIYNDIYIANFTYNFFFAAGLKYKKIYAELRYYTTHNLTDESISNASFSQTSLLLKYEIFKK